MVLPNWRGGHNPKAKAAAAKMPIPAIAMAVGSYAGSIHIAGSSKPGLNTPTLENATTRRPVFSYPHPH